MNIPDLPTADDLYGRIWLEAWSDGDVAFAIRRDDGYLDTSLVVTHAPLVDTASTDLPEPLAGLTGRVLDLACGPGLHLVALQNRGLEVVGVDVSAGAVRVARERGGRDVRLAPMDHADLCPGGFDAAILMGNTIGIGGRLDIVTTRLDCLREAIRPGGLLVADACDPEATDRPEHLAYHAARRREGRYPGEISIRLEYAGLASPWFDHTLVSPQALAAAGETTGWEVVEVTGPPRSARVMLVRS